MDRRRIDAGDRHSHASLTRGRAIARTREVNFLRLLRVLALCVTFTAQAVWAGRPLDTEDTGTIEAGKGELELSLDYATDGANKLGAFKGVLGVGVLPRLEARIEATALLLDIEGEKTRGGIGDSIFGVKYRFFEEADALPAALGSVVLRLPTGDEQRGLGAEGVDVTLLAVLSKAFGPVTLTWNGGYTFVTQERELDTWILAGALEYRATDAWTLVGEVFSTLGADQAPDTAILRVGNVFAVTERIKLDAAVGFGITRDTPDVLVTVGATIALF